MDPNDYLSRVNQRSKMLGDLDISVISEVGDQENSFSTTKESKTHDDSQSLSKAFNPKEPDIPEIDKSTTEAGIRSPFRSVDNSLQFSASDSLTPTSPLKSKFAKLSKEYTDFSVDIKPMKTKDDYIQGPTKRISMGGEKSTAEFFAPKPISSPVASDVSAEITTSTPQSAARKTTFPASPLSNPNVSIISAANETFDNSINGIFTFGKKIESVPSQSDTSKIEPSKPFYRATDKDSTPVKTSLSKESIPSLAKPYGQNVNALRQKFDAPTSSQPEKTVDNSRTNFRKARGLFEKSIFKSDTKPYESPYATKREQAVTNIRRYDDPNPTKKPAQCEIVSGPNFKQSINYWQQRVTENPSNDIVDAAVTIFKPAQKRNIDPFGSNSSTLSGSGESSCKVSKFEDKKPTAMEEVNKLVRFADEGSDEDDEEREDETSYQATENTSWAETFKVKSIVLTESFTSNTTSRKPSVTTSALSLSVPSDSFDYQQSPQASAALPLGSSLLEDINQDFTKIHTPRPARAGGDGSEAGTPTRSGLVHSLSTYRRAEATTTPRTKKMVDENRDSVKELMSPTLKPGQEMIRPLSQNFVSQKLKEIEYAQTVVTDQIQQAQKAITVARQRNSKSLNFEQEVELLQKLAVLNERRRAYYLEIGRLTNSSDLHYIFPRAKIRFNKICVDVHRHLDVAPNHFCFLFALVRYQDQVVSTRAVYINDIIAKGLGTVEFADFLELENMSPDFQLSVEIYGLTLVRKDNGNEKRFNLKRIVSSPIPEKKHSPEIFSRIGQIVIQRSDINGSVLDLSPFETPLAGHIRIHSTCHVSDPDDNRWAGFVSIYRTVDGKGAWELCYSNIVNNRLNFWKYPEDADTKPPILSLNIRDMASLAHTVCDAHMGFQYDFEMKMLDVNEEIVRIMLSTAEERDRERVIGAVNRSYKYVNTWRN